MNKTSRLLFQNFTRIPIALCFLVCLLSANVYGHNKMGVSGDTPTIGSCDGIPVLVNPTVADINAMGATTFAIMGNVSIDDYQSLNITGKTIKMIGADAAIYLGSHSVLRLENTVIEGCDNMWSGIECISDHTQILIYGNSQVNDMYYGIELGMDGYYYLVNSQFNRNYQTIVAMGNSPLQFEFICWGNTIDGAGLKPHWNGSNVGAQAFRGFHFRNVISNQDKKVKVGDLTQMQNVFKHCGVGILAEFSKFDIENNRFVAFNTGGPGRAIDVVSDIEHTIQNCTFDYCVRAIGLSNSYYKVLNNHFNHVGYCLTAVHSRKNGSDLPTVSGSVVNGANDGFSFVYNDDSNPQFINNTDIQNMGQSGVVIYDLDPVMPNRSKISGNTMMLKSGFGTPATGGIGSENGAWIVGTQKASICDNSFTYDGLGLDHGIDAWTSTNSIITNNTYTQTGATSNTGSGTRALLFSSSKFDCNYYSGNETGLQIMGPCLFTDITTQHFLGPHTTGLLYSNAATKPQLHAGNAWEGVSQVSALGIGIDVMENLFTVDCADGNQFCPLNVNPQDWFLPQSGDTKTCNSSTVGCTLPPPLLPPTPPVPSDEAMAIRVIGNQLVYPNYSNCSNWMSTRQTLQWIADHNLQNTGIYASYWNAKSNTSAGKLAQLTLNANALQQIQGALDAQIATVWSDIQQLSSISPLSAAQSYTLMSRLQELNYLRLTQQNNWLAFVTQIRNVSEALPVANIYEDNQKKVNLILCDLYTRQTLECQASELTTLQSVAIQCPLEGGAAVLQARGILSILGQEYTGSDCMVSTEQDNNGTPVVANALLVMPNPGDGNFQVALPSGNLEDWTLEIFDLQGKRQWQSPAKNDTYNTSLPTGFYLLVCSNVKDGRRISEKLVVQQ